MSDNENDLSDMHVNENEDLLNEEIEAGGDGDEEIDAASDASLDTIKAKFKEMQEEAEKIRQMQTDMAKEMNISTTSSSGGGNSNQQLNLSVEEKMEIDSRSIYVGNVDYGATAEELEAHFHGCGSVNRVTIQIDKYSGQPKGFAYIEFADKDSVQTAIALDDSLFRGRQIKVSMKRTNRPGISSTNRPPRGRGIRGARVIIKYIYPGSRRPRGYPSRNGCEGCGSKQEGNVKENHNWMCF